MRTGPRRVTVRPESELARLIEEAGDGPVLLEKDGAMYLMERSGGVGAGYDPERLRQALRAHAGSLGDSEAEELKAYISSGRQEGSRPADGP